MKLKKLANRPAKQEKRRKQLMKRSETLKAQAEKLLAQSQKASLQYERLVDKRKVSGSSLGVYEGAVAPSCFDG